MIAPYSDERRLAVDLLDKICRDTGIIFLQAFEQMSLIHKVLTHENSGHRHGDPPDEV